MEELFNLGLNEKMILEMYEVYPNLKELTKEEIVSKVEILKSIGCTNREILNIISSNAMYLDRIDEDILNLINYLKTIGFKCLGILFDANPYILNLDVFEIENYIKEKQTNGELLEDIIDTLDSNPYLFNEM